MAHCSDRPSGWRDDAKDPVRGDVLAVFGQESQSGVLDGRGAQQHDACLRVLGQESPQGLRDGRVAGGAVEPIGIGRRSHQVHGRVVPLPWAAPPVTEEGIEGEAQGRGEPDAAAGGLLQRRHGVRVGDHRQVGKTQGRQGLAHGWIGRVHRHAPRVLWPVDRDVNGMRRCAGMATDPRPVSAAKPTASSRTLKVGSRAGHDDEVLAGAPVRVQRVVGHHHHHPRMHALAQGAPGRRRPPGAGATTDSSAPGRGQGDTRPLMVADRPARRDPGALMGPLRTKTWEPSDRDALDG